MKKAINGFRFYFALTVVMCHMYFLDDAPTRVSLIYNNILKNGGFAVSFFFCLSGFVMALKYRDCFNEITKKTYIEFIKKRFVSFYGIYIFTNILAAIIKLSSNELSIGDAVLELLASAVFCQTFSFKYYAILNEPLWYMACLAILYCLTPIILHILRGIRRKRAIFTFILLYLLILLMIYIYILIVKIDIFEFRNVFILFYGTPLTRIIVYILGIISAFICMDYQENINELIEKIRVHSFLEIFAIVCCIMSYFLGLVVERYVISNAFYIPVFCFLLIVFFFEKGIVSRFLKNEFNQHLSKISNYLYMFHFIIINFGGSAFILSLWSGESEIKYIMVAIVLVVVSIFVAEMYYQGNKIAKRKKK